MYIFLEELVTVIFLTQFIKSKTVYFRLQLSEKVKTFKTICGVKIKNFHIMTTEEKNVESSFEEGDPEDIFQILQPLGGGFV